MASENRSWQAIHSSTSAKSYANLIAAELAYFVAQTAGAIKFAYDFADETKESALIHLLVYKSCKRIFYAT